MSEIQIPDTVLVYKALELHPQGISIQDLAERSEVTEDRVDAILKTFAEGGLVSVHDRYAHVTKWWDLQRFDIVFQLPWIDEAVFRNACEDLEANFKDFKSAQYYTLKPYSHETTLEIILTITSGVVLAEFFRAFFNQWGTKAAAVSEELFRKYRKDGVKEICINGTFHPQKGGDDAKFNFEVRASSKEEVLKGVQFVEEELLTALQAKKLTSDFVRNTENWKITVWKS